MSTNENEVTASANAKRTRSVTKTIERDESGKSTGNLTFKFSDGSEIQFNKDSVPADTLIDLIMHGASQKIGDSYASASGETDPLAFAKACVQDTIDQLYKGEWRSNIGAGGTRITDLAVVLSRLTGKTAEESQAFVDSLDDEQKKAWKGKAKVKAGLAQYAAEKAAEKAKKLAAAADAADKSNVEADDEEISFA